MAFEQAEDRDKLAEIVDFYNKTDSLSRLASLSLLKDAIWRRGRGQEEDRSSAQEIGPPITASSDVLPPPPPATNVYALMGFYQRRIVPTYKETEMQALARLCLENNTDLFGERMIASLPSVIQDSACWYADNDVYGANLWDIEPTIQVAGVTEDASLVLDGCRSCSICWKQFPKVEFAIELSFRRGLALLVGALSFIILLAGVGVLAGTKNIVTVIIIVIGAVGFFGSPWLIQYGRSGRVYGVSPWLIGVEGTVDPTSAEAHIYGTTPWRKGGPQKIRDTPSGSEFARPDTVRTDVRRGLRVVSDIERDIGTRRPGYKVFTLIDTKSNTIYYFQAKSLSVELPA